MSVTEQEIFARKPAENTEIRVTAIRPSALNPRKRFDESALQELADSIREHGLLEPIVVRWIENQGYEIIAGERRWQAAQLAGLDSIPCRVLDNISDQEALELALVENLVRRDIDPIEEAELPRIANLHYDTYERLDFGAPAGCRDDCEHRSIALNSSNKPEPVCLDPKCYRRLKMADGRAKGKQMRENHRAALSRAIDALDAGALDEEMAILACWSEIRSAYKEPLRDALEHLHLPVTEKDIVDSYGGLSKDRCWKKLLSLDPASVIRLAAELRIRQEIETSIRNGYSNHEDTDWLIKRYESKAAQ